MLQTYNPHNQDLIVNINGQLVHRDQAGVSPFDSSVQNGDAVWEGLRLYDGGIFKLYEHLDRLLQSAAMLQYEGVPSREHIVHQLERTLQANRMFTDVHVRLTLSRGLKYTSGLDPRLNIRGCSLFVLAEHKPRVYDRAGIHLITARHRRPPPHVLDQRIHSCNQLTSILAKLEANVAGADDALMLDTRGYLAETNATHVFIVRGGLVLTSTCIACPEGITRATVLELCQRLGQPYDVRDVTPEELYAADEMFVSGTMGELVPVLTLDGRRIGSPELPVPGPILSQISAGFAAEIPRCCTRLVEPPPREGEGSTA
jgi:branched-chain amino acid aminotransferase